jgi:mannose-6-phosphate isomerase-like protein (cupin superfamily)
MTLQTPLILTRDAGSHFDFLNTLTTVKVGGDRSGGVLSCVELLAPRGFGPPLHRHDVEDELFHITEGEVRFVCGDADETVTSGATVWLPKLLPHQFQVLSETARIFQISTPAQFEDFVAAVGTPMESAVLPEPSEIDGQRLAELCGEFQIEVLGPPLPPPA